MKQSEKQMMAFDAMQLLEMEMTAIKGGVASIGKCQTCTSSCSPGCSPGGQASTS